MDEQSRPKFFRRAIRRRWRIILVAFLLGVVAVPAYLAASTTEYRATSVVFLEPLVGNPYSPTTPSGRQEQLAALTTEAGLLVSDSVASSAEQAGREAGIDLGPRIQERTFTEVPSNSQVVNVSFTGSTPEAAQVGAQALATAYLEYRQSRSEQVTDAQLARLDQEVESLSTLVDSASSALKLAQGPDTNTAAAEVLRLEEQLRIYANQYGQLRIERVNVESASTSPGEIVSPAQTPNQPEGISAPLIATAMVLALLGCGLIAAVVLEHLDSRLRTVDEIERLGIGPVYGMAPLWRPELRGTAAEDAYRLATLASQRGIHGLLGASTAVPIEVAAGLAHTLSDVGHSVVIVLATPHAAPTDGAGLSDALASDGAGAEVEPQQFESGIHVLTAGSAPDSLPRLLHRPAFATLIGTLAARHDVVIIVGEAAWSASGAAVARVSDRAVLVATSAETREDQMLAAVRTVKECDAQLDGALLAVRPARSWIYRASHGADDARLQALLGRPSGNARAARFHAEDAASPLVATPRRNGGS